MASYVDQFLQAAAFWCSRLFFPQFHHELNFIRQNAITYLCKDFNKYALKFIYVYMPANEDWLKAVRKMVNNGPTWLGTQFERPSCCSFLRRANF